MKRNDALFYTCSLIECIGRETRQTRDKVIHFLGDDLRRIYTHADVFHCEPLKKVAYDFIERDSILQGEYDVTEGVRYTVPDCFEIGEVFARLIQRRFPEEKVLEGVREVYASWITPAILNFNSDLYYQTTEYLVECYQEGSIIAA